MALTVDRGAESGQETRIHARCVAGARLTFSKNILEKRRLGIEGEVADSIIVVKTNRLPHSRNFLFHNKQNTARAKPSALFQQRVKDVPLPRMGLHLRHGSQQLVAATTASGESRLHFLHGTAYQLVPQLRDAALQNLRGNAPYYFVNPRLICHWEVTLALYRLPGDLSLGEPNELGQITFDYPAIKLRRIPRWAVQL